MTTSSTIESTRIALTPGLGVRRGADVVGGARNFVRIECRKTQSGSPRPDSWNRERNFDIDQTQLYCCVVIPAWIRGLLPPGVHQALWEEIEQRFGFTAHRKRLLRGLRGAMTALKVAGCQRAWIDGSFVTDKEVPNDFDACWDVKGVDVALLDPVILDVNPPRFAQRVKYGGDILPNVNVGGMGPLFVEFFQVDRDTGDPKGILELDLRRFS